jgi:hypothetical protein
MIMEALPGLNATLPPPLCAEYNLNGMSRPDADYTKAYLLRVQAIS